RVSLSHRGRGGARAGARAAPGARAGGGRPPPAPGRGCAVEELTMVEALTDDRQRLLALNEIYLGAPGHQTARYRIGPDDPAANAEAQASSGVLVGTGTGATGWLRSLWEQRTGSPALPDRVDARLVWFVREAWPSPVTGTSLVAGELSGAGRLRITVESDRLVAFGDGMEGDALDLTWGQSVSVGVSDTALRLVG
ncbi:hypothetical protein ACFW17_24475, partial [Streptomyces sp. NPDC058961]